MRRRPPRSADWKFRAVAGSYLSSKHSLPQSHRPSISDRLRRRFFLTEMYETFDLESYGPDLFERDTRLRGWAFWPLLVLSQSAAP
jgi:hypothetical protein